MRHLEEDDLVNAYYGDGEPGERAHLESCAECRARLESLRSVLDAVRESPAPERGPAYGRTVWAALEPKLTPRRTRHSWMHSWWTLGPAVAVLLVIVFLAGRWSGERRPASTPSKQQERVLLLALSEHLERSQIVLAELLNQPPGTAELAAADRERARDLLEENRLLRQTASLNGDKVHAALLDELERTLLAIANESSSAKPGDFQQLQRRVENQSLLWKVRISSSDARAKGQKL